MKNKENYIFICLFLINIISSSFFIYCYEANQEIKSDCDLVKNDSYFVIAVHGGAEPTYKRELMTFEYEKELKRGIFNSLKQGYNLLKQKKVDFLANIKTGVCSDFKEKYHLEAVKASVISLENNPLFNAAKGGKITHNFEVECDASIMDGKDLSCGAVCSLKRIKNPILLAELVKDKTKHILLSSTSAEEFGIKNNIEIVDNSYFLTEENIKEWKSLDLSKKSTEYGNKEATGTIGVVVLDFLGNLAAGTSTGGTTFKMPGRIGDAPIIGASTYANNNSIAVSCTGVGEEMIRRSTAFDIHARYTYKSLSLKEATDEVMNEIPENVGGFVSIDKFGNVAMPFNTEGMGRGFVNSNGVAYIAILKEEFDITPIHYEIEKEFEDHY